MSEEMLWINPLDKEKLSVMRDFHIELTGNLEIPEVSHEPHEVKGFEKWLGEYVNKTVDDMPNVRNRFAPLLVDLRDKFTREFGTSYSAGRFEYRANDRVSRHRMSAKQRLAWYLSSNIERLYANSGLESAYPIGSPAETFNRALTFLGVRRRYITIGNPLDGFVEICASHAGRKAFMPKKPTASTVDRLVNTVHKLEDGLVYYLGRGSPYNQVFSIESNAVRSLLREKNNLVDVPGYQLLCEVIAEKWIDCEVMARPAEYAGNIDLVELNNFVNWGYETNE